MPDFRRSQRAPVSDRATAKSMDVARLSFIETPIRQSIYGVEGDLRGQAPPRLHCSTDRTHAGEGPFTGAVAQDAGAGESLATQRLPVLRRPRSRPGGPEAARSAAVP